MFDNQELFFIVATLTFDPEVILHGEIRCYEFEDIIDITDSHHEKKTKNNNINNKKTVNNYNVKNKNRNKNKNNKNNNHY